MKFGDVLLSVGRLGRVRAAAPVTVPGAAPKRGGSLAGRVHGRQRQGVADLPGDGLPALATTEEPSHFDAGPPPMWPSMLTQARHHGWLFEIQNGERDLQEEERGHQDVNGCQTKHFLGPPSLVYLFFCLMVACPSPFVICLLGCLVLPLAFDEMLHQDILISSLLFVTWITIRLIMLPNIVIHPHASECFKMLPWP